MGALWRMAVVVELDLVAGVCSVCLVEPSWASAPRGIPRGEVSQWGRRGGRGPVAGVSGNARRDRPVVPGSEGLRPGATCEVCGYRGHWPRECLSGKPRAAAVQPPASGSTDAATALLATLNGLVVGRVKGGSM